MTFAGLQGTSDGGGVGGGDASAANQTTQIALETEIRDRLPASVGAKAAAASFPVTLAADGALVSSVGAAADAAASTDTGTFTLLSFIKRALQNWTTLLARVPALVSGRIPVQAVPQQGTLTDRSGTITAGGTAQQMMASNASRLGWWVQNVSTADLWINGTGTASAASGSIRLAPGALYETPAGAVGSAAVSIFGATTGQAFTAREF